VMITCHECWQWNSLLRTHIWVIHWPLIILPGSNTLVAQRLKKKMASAITTGHVAIRFCFLVHFMSVFERRSHCVAQAALERATLFHCLTLTTWLHCVMLASCLERHRLSWTDFTSFHKGYSVSCVKGYL
jgi:hypothetical protein